MANKPTPFFNKSVSNYLKGIGLILMFMHHFLCFPDWYAGYNDFPGLSEYFPNATDITSLCVVFFAFITGYLAFHYPIRSFSGYFKKSLRFLSYYWIAFIPILLIGVFVNHGTVTLKDVLLGIVGASIRIMPFCWYVSFYLFITFTLTLAYNRFSKNFLSFSLVAFILPKLVYACILLFIDDSMLIFFAKSNCFLSIVVIGYVFAKFSLLEKFDKLIRGNWICRTITGLVLITGGIIICQHTDFRICVYAFLLVVIGLIFIFKNIENKRALYLKPLEILGEYSALLWFFSNGFFEINSNFKKYVYWIKNPVILIIWALALSLIPSVAAKFSVDKIWNRIVRKK